MSLRLHIDRLVLDGMPLTHDGGPQVQASIVAELTRLLTEGGLSAGVREAGALPALRVADISVGSAHSHHDLGRCIAGALYEGIGK